LLSFKELISGMSEGPPSAVYTPEAALQIFNSHRRENPSLVFSISRSCDSKQIAYSILREGDALVRERVKCRSVVPRKEGISADTPNDWKTQEELSPMLLKNFYGIEVLPIPDTKKYTGKLAAFPERTFVVGLLPNKSTSSDGNATATTVFEYADGLVIRDCKVYDIFMDMSFDSFGVPNVRKIWLIAFTAIANVKHLNAAQLKQFTKPLSDTHVYVVEPIEVTEQIRSRFDAAGLTKQFIASVIAGK